MNARERQPHRTICRWTREHPHATGYARAQLRPQLIALNLHTELVDDVLLAATELVTNAIEHAEGPYELRLRTGATEHILECHDRSRFLPPVPLTTGGPPRLPVGGPTDLAESPIAQLAEGGRGLLLVNHLFGGCLSARRTPLGKAVYIAFGAARGR